MVTSAVCSWSKVVDLCGNDPSDWPLLAMRENTQLSASGKIPLICVRSSLWASQLQKVLQSLTDASLLPGGVALMYADSGPQLIKVDQAAKIF